MGFKNWSVLTKVLSITVVTIVILVAGALFYVVPTVNARLMDEKMSKTRGVVEAACSLIDRHIQAADAGRMSDAEARALALDELRAMRYQGSEYFFVIDHGPKILMHPFKPELEGKDATGMTDPNGKALFVAMVDEVKGHEGGFVDYQWPKPGAAKPVDKLTYVQTIDRWGWIVGTGIYVDDVAREVGALRLRILGGVAGVALAALAIAWLVASRVRRNLAHAMDTSSRIAGGDLRGSVTSDSRDETGKLLETLGVMKTSLTDIVTEVRAGAIAIADATAQVSTGNNDLARRTESQAAALEETAASIEELSATVKTNADSARRGHELARGASEVAHRGADMLHQLVTTMDSIKESSQKIADITSVIDGIAFQTNILALNAAIEAAQAGEQGRGFAVVSAEVRSLAVRSAAAAKEIKTLIEASVEKVHQGSAFVHDAADTTRHIQQSIEEVTSMMGGISGASEEQATGLAQIGTAMAQLDDVTHQNAALVEEGAAASASLQDQARELVERVARFQVETARAHVRNLRPALPEKGVRLALAAAE